MTGQYSVRNGLSLIAIEGSPYTLPANAFTMGELFKSVGYARDLREMAPWKCTPKFADRAGFDEFYGIRRILAGCSNICGDNRPHALDQ